MKADEKNPIDTLGCPADWAFPLPLGRIAYLCFSGTRPMNKQDIEVLIQYLEIAKKAMPHSLLAKEVKK